MSIRHAASAVLCFVLMGLAAAHGAVFGGEAGGAAGAPSGTYTGNKNILGARVHSQIVIDDATHADLNLNIDGLLKIGPINCPKEQYSLDAGTGVVTVPGIDTQGDCVHDQLGKYGIKLQSVAYDADKDTFTIKVHAIILDVVLVLGKGTMEVDMTIHEGKPFNEDRTRSLRGSAY